MITDSPLSLCVKLPFSAGLGAGLALASVRPVVGLQPNIIQDLFCTVVGAFVGQTAGLSGGYLLARRAMQRDPEVATATGPLLIIGALGGLAIGVATGVISSVALN